jgi:hypothetical protein
MIRAILEDAIELICLGAFVALIFTIALAIQ